MITEDHIKKLLELEAKATPGDWREVSRGSNAYRELEIRNLTGGILFRSMSYSKMDEDAAFIAETRNIFRELAEDWLRMKQKKAGE